MINVHFMGIGGSGTSAVASIAKNSGFTISGCDKTPYNQFTSHLNKKILFVDHSKKHLDNIDILALSPAILSLDSENQEIIEAKKRKIEILTWQEFMGKYLEKDKFVIAVCGTHGKSTTTAMIALLLEDADLDPTVELGATLHKWGKNFRIGSSKYFITEADEFNDNFLVSHPDILVLTTVEMDHPEYFKDFAAVKLSFAKFINQTKKLIIANFEDPGVIEVLKIAKPKLKIIDYSTFKIDFRLKILGKYNILNAQAAYQVGTYLGINPKVITKSLSNFAGLKRRFELIGEYQKAQIFSDFGHHPTEVKVTIEAAKEKYRNKKLILIYQPHMFSRTKYLFNDFVKVFQNLKVDHAFILDIYPSREFDTGIINSKQLVKAVAKPNIEYVENEKKLLQNLLRIANKNYVFIFMGAGETDKISKQFAIQPK